MDTKQKIDLMVFGISESADVLPKDWNPALIPGLVKPNRVVQTTFADDESVIIAFYSNFDQKKLIENFSVLELIRGVVEKSYKVKSTVHGDYVALLHEISDILSGKSR